MALKNVIGAALIFASSTVLANGGGSAGTVDFYIRDIAKCQIVPNGQAVIAREFLFGSRLHERLMLEEGGNSIIYYLHDLNKVAFPLKARFTNREKDTYRGSLEIQTDGSGLIKLEGGKEVVLSGCYQL